MKSYKKQLAMQIGFMVLCLIVTVINCKDLLTWFLETVPVMIGIAILFFTRDSFPIPSMLAFLIAIHSLVLSVGGHYTYAEVPFGYWMQDAFHLSRNHYDRIGHFLQGFMPAILAREIFIRKRIVSGKRWIFFLVICVCLAFSAFYELIEWWTALVSKEASAAFLGTQGDVWDTQWDMFFALIGASVAQLTVSGWHEKQMRLCGYLPQH